MRPITSRAGLRMTTTFKRHALAPNGNGEVSVAHFFGRLKDASHKFICDKLRLPRRRDLHRIAFVEKAEECEHSHAARSPVCMHRKKINTAVNAVEAKSDYDGTALLPTKTQSGRRPALAQRVNRQEHIRRPLCRRRESCHTDTNKFPRFHIRPRTSSRCKWSRYK